MEIFTITQYVGGTLAANQSLIFTVPFDCQLIHVSAVGSNANSGTLQLGTTTTAEAYMVAASIGDSNAPVEFDRDNFVGSQFPHILKGTVFAAALDFDGAAGTATQNYSLVMTFTHG
jgi:hypothetical protein